MDQLGRLDLRVLLDLFLYFDRPRVPGGTLIPVAMAVEMGVAVKQNAQLASMWLGLVSIRGVVRDVTTLVSTVVLLPEGWNFFCTISLALLLLLTHVYWMKNCMHYCYVKLFITLLLIGVFLRLLIPACGL